MMTGLSGPVFPTGGIMMKMIAVLLLSLLLLACETSPGQGEIIPGNKGIVTVENVTATSLSLRWSRAYGNTDSREKLEYLVYLSLTSLEKDIAQIEAAADPFGVYTADIETRDISGLLAGTTYYFYVVVRDSLGNRALYEPISEKTLDVMGLAGEELKKWLRDTYYTGKHKSLGYDTARRYMYNYIDNESGTLICVYSGFSQAVPYGGTTTFPDPINCEHTVPQSFFDKRNPMVSDLHHLYPTHMTWNGVRGSYPFNDIDDNLTTKWMYEASSQPEIPSADIDFYSESNGSEFEPPEAHKGNLARAVFYFYTMYPTEAGAMSKVADGDLLYQWHLSDPVDATERERNDAIEQYQGDRNPYIDHPDYVAQAWGY